MGERTVLLDESGRYDEISDELGGALWDTYVNLVKAGEIEPPTITIEIGTGWQSYCPQRNNGRVKMGKEFEPDSAGEIPIHLAFTREMLGKHIAELEQENKRIRSLSALAGNDSLIDADIRIAELEAKLTSAEALIGAHNRQFYKLEDGFAHALYESEHLDDAIMYACEHLGVMSESEYLALLGKESEDDTD